MPEVQPRFNDDGTTATFNQTDVLPLVRGGFANMNKTKYAWARAFPTVFIPTYRQISRTYKWVILRGLNGWDGVQDKEKLSFHNWMKYMTWRSDGKPALHHTFMMVLSNHKMNTQMQQQGRYVLDTLDFDTTTMIEVIKTAIQNAGNGGIQCQTENILKRTHIHSSNIPGTMRYWRGAFQEFMVNTFIWFLHSQEEFAAVCTGSLAEYLDHHL
jgi:hypothetical protein